MTDTQPTGRCLCGAVRYTLTEPAKELAACHCAMCRRFSGGVMLAAELPRSAVRFADEQNLKVFASSEWAERGFCDRCGSSLFWRMTTPGFMDDVIMICAGTLDSLDEVTFTHEVYIDNKPDAYAFEGHRTQLTEADIMAMVNATQEGNAQ